MPGLFRARQGRMERLSRDTAHAKRLAVAKAWLTAAMIGVIACAALASAVQSESLVLKGSHILGRGHVSGSMLTSGFHAKVQSLEGNETSSANETAAEEEPAKAEEEPAKAEEEPKAEKKDDEKEEVAEGKEKEVVKSDTALMDLSKTYIANHPDVSNRIFLQSCAGLFLAVVAMGALMYSEISSCMVYRELDQIKKAELESAPKSVSLQQKILWWYGGYKALYRPIITLSATLLFVIAAIVGLLAECAVYDGLAETYDLSKTSYGSDCLLRSIMLGIVDGVGIAFFFIAIIWICTRTGLGLGALCISAFSDIIRSTNKWWLVIVWAVVVGGGAFWAYRSTADDEELAEGEGYNIVGAGKRDYV